MRVKIRKPHLQDLYSALSFLVNSSSPISASSLSLSSSSSSLYHKKYNNKVLEVITVHIMK
ncbi:hypothetical protein HanIR_Chr16g0787111 [Helianthus annuus]|nr:hypothetical protein HanIR_Chr16g0787111 [Helianthus annuus]